MPAVRGHGGSRGPSSCGRASVAQRVQRRIGEECQGADLSDSALHTRHRHRASFRLPLTARRTFPGTDTFVKLLEIGPPVGRPVQYRVSGPDIAKIKEFAQGLAGIVRNNPHLDNVVFDWMEPARVVKVDVLKDKARQLGVSSEDIATTLNSVLDGTSITQVRDSIYLVNVVGRATARERASIDTVRDIQLIGLGGRAVPLGAVATVRYEIEQPTIWRRSRLPTVTLKASTLGSVQPKTVVDQLAPQVAEFARRLPAGYSVAIGGAVEESTKSQNPIIAVVPLMLFLMATILMVQLQSFHRLFLVFAVAPLAVIGVVLALLPSGAPLGFVAILGVMALIGILIRNSVILVVQIKELEEAGRPAWQAVVEATEHRMRPIMLTAAAASLGLIPIAREIFWGPMAYAMMGGIIVGTVQVKDLGEATTKAAMDSLNDLGETASKTAMSVKDLGETATKTALKNVKDLSEAATKTALKNVKDLSEAATKTAKEGIKELGESAEAQ